MPDFLSKETRSRFWHGLPDFFTPGKSGDYWDAKIARPQERDKIANETLAPASAVRGG